MLCPDCLRLRHECECPRCPDCKELEDYCGCDPIDFDDNSDDLTDKEDP